MAAVVHGGNVWQGETPGRWLDFSANLRPEGSAPWAMDAACRALSQMRFYPAPQMRAARQGLAEYLGVPPQCVLPTAGGLEALRLAMELLAEAGTRAMTVFAPAFGEYMRLAARAGICAQEARAYAHCGALPVEKVLPSPSAASAAVVCNPNNPTGCTYGREALLSLFDGVRAAGGALLVDEAFIDFCPERTVADAAAGMQGLYVAGSLTKSLGVPGIRLGYLVGGAEWIARAQEAAGPWPLNCAALAIAEALPCHAAQLREEAAQNALRRVQLAEGLRSLGARVYPSEANFLLADFGVALQEAREALRKQGILVRACESFPLLDGGQMRFAVKTHAENAALLDALSQALGALRGGD